VDKNQKRDPEILKRRVGAQVKKRLIADQKF